MSGLDVRTCPESGLPVTSCQEHLQCPWPNDGEWLAGYELGLRHARAEARCVHHDPNSGRVVIDYEPG